MAVKAGKKRSQRVKQFRTLLLVVFIIISIIIWRKIINKKSNLNHGDNLFDYSNQEIKVDRNEPDWKLILINAENPLPKNFKVATASVEKNHLVDKRIASDLKKMLADARDKGLSPEICSAYRPKNKQATLFKSSSGNKEAKKEDGEIVFGEQSVAKPGCSEHEAGLAVDIVSSKYKNLDENQEQTKEAKWFMENCHKYGFILRYPKGKEKITGIVYEPWHYRYVGKYAAGEIKKRNITLEEYLKNN